MIAKKSLIDLKKEGITAVVDLNQNSEEKDEASKTGLIYLVDSRLRILQVCDREVASGSLSSGPAGYYALVLEGDSIFSSNRYLLEYDLHNASELLSIGVANVSNIVSFNAFSQIAVLQLIDGSYEMLNLTSHMPC